METLVWVVENLLLPVARVFFFPLDFLLAWLFYLPPVLAIAVLGVLTGLGVNLFMKWASDQPLLGRAKADLARIAILRAAAWRAGAVHVDGSRPSSSAMDSGFQTPIMSNLQVGAVREPPLRGPQQVIEGRGDGGIQPIRAPAGPTLLDDGDPDRLNRLANRINRIYAWGSLKPSLWTVLPICVMAMWMGSRLAYQPIRPGEVVELTAHFEDGAKGFLHLLPNEMVVAAGAPIAVVALPETGSATGSAPIPTGGVEARLKVRFPSEGHARLVLVHSDISYHQELSIRQAGGLPPEPVRVFSPETPTMDGLTRLELGLADSVPAAWWNLHLKWVGIYLLVALTCAFAFRFLLGIH